MEFQNQSPGWVTAKELLFNDPRTGKLLIIPIGERCVPIESLREGIGNGFIDRNDEMAIWAARTNLKHNYKLVLLRNMVRGVPEGDFVYVDPRNKTQKECCDTECVVHFAQ